jgi:PAS domain S-box-containing protein
MCHPTSPSGQLPAAARCGTRAPSSSGQSRNWQVSLLVSPLEGTIACTPQPPGVQSLAGPQGVGIVRSNSQSAWGSDCAIPRSASGPDDLNRMPALLLLDRLAVPVLAADCGGVIVFANHALAELLGHTKQSLLDMTMRHILRDLSPSDSVLPFLRAHAGHVVSLTCAQGSTIQVHLSDSAMRRNDERVALVTLEPVHRNLAADHAPLRLV